MVMRLCCFDLGWRQAESDLKAGISPRFSYIFDNYTQGYILGIQYFSFYYVKSTN